MELNQPSILQGDGFVTLCRFTKVAFESIIKKEHNS